MLWVFDHQHHYVYMMMGWAILFELEGLKRR